MRADRLVSLVLLLRRRGRMSAREIARELEVTERTVHRDIEALSTAGVPVFAQRGRHGGFELLPGFRTELTGLSAEESVALLAQGSTSHGDPPLAAALRKVLDALPPEHGARAAEAAGRLLLDAETDLLSRPRPEDPVDPAVLAAVREAVVRGRRLELAYAAAGDTARDRVVDPIGLVTARGVRYLLALRDGEDRTYRLSRMRTARLLEEAARRPEQVDLPALWRRRCEQFLAGSSYPVTVRVEGPVREELTSHALGVGRRVREADAESEGVLGLVFQDLRHADWALWPDADRIEVLDPPELRDRFRERARAVLDRFG